MGILNKIFAKRKSGEDRPDSTRTPFRYSGGVFVTPETSLEVAAFHRGVIYTATQIAKLPWCVKDMDNQTLNEHQIAYLLRVAVNNEMSSFQFRILMTICAIVYGNGYAEIEKTPSGKIIGLHPIHPRRVCPDRTPAGKLYYRVSSGEFNSEGTEVETYLLPEQMFVVRGFLTWDGIVGQGVPSFAYETLGTAAGANKFANNLYANSGIPSGVLTVQGRLSDEAYKRMKDQWDENHSGKKVGGTALLEEGTRYEALTLDPQVMQFIESRKFSVIEIARFLGIPPSKLYDTDVATYANMEQANLEVATDTLDAWARNFESEADIKLLNYGRGGLKTEMDLYAIFRGDMNSRSTYFTKMMQTAAITPNEIRKKEGMAPYEGGSRFYIASNNFTPADRLDEVLDSQITKGTSTVKSESEEGKEDDDVDEELKGAMVDFLKNRTKG